MAGKITFTMIKPNSIATNDIGAIINMMNENGFIIKAMKMTKMSHEQAEGFYAVHKGKPFFEHLIEFMTSGPIVAMVLEKPNAIEAFRELIGSTDPEKAAAGTIRKLFAESLTRNAVHGSDSDENAIIESRYFFSDIEIF